MLSELSVPGDGGQQWCRADRQRKHRPRRSAQPQEPSANHFSGL